MGSPCFRLALCFQGLPPHSHRRLVLIKDVLGCSRSLQLSDFHAAEKLWIYIVSKLAYCTLDLDVSPDVSFVMSLFVCQMIPHFFQKKSEESFDLFSGTGGRFCGKYHHQSCTQSCQLASFIWVPRSFIDP